MKLAFATKVMYSTDSWDESNHRRYLGRIDMFLQVCNLNSLRHLARASDLGSRVHLTDAIPNHAKVKCHSALILVN